MHRRGSVTNLESLKVFVELLLSHRTETLSTGTFLCFRKKSGMEKNYVKKGRGKVSMFSEQFFPQSSETIRMGDPSMVLKVSSIGKMVDKRRGFTFLRVKLFVSQRRKVSWGSLQCFKKIGVSNNFMHKRELLRYTIENF